MKLCVPEPPEVADFVGRADLVAMGEALCVAGAEVAGVAEGADVVEDPDGEDGLDGADKAVAELPAVADDAAVGEFPPSPAHAVRPVPAITTAMITAGTRHIRMCFYPSVSNQTLQIAKTVAWVTR